MDCFEFEKNVYDFASGEADEALRAEMKKHMESCEHCKEEYRRCLIIVRSLKAMGEVEAPPTLLENVMAGIETAQNKKPLSSKINTAVKFASAAAAAIVVFAGTMAVAPRFTQNAQLVKSDLEKTENTAQQDEAYLEEEVALANEIPAPQEETAAFTAENAAADTPTATSDTVGRVAKARSSVAMTSQKKATESEMNSNATAPDEGEVDLPATSQAASSGVAQASAQAMDGVAAFSLAADEEESASVESEGAEAGEQNRTARALSIGSGEERYVKVTVEFKIQSDYAEEISAADNQTAEQMETRLNELNIPYEKNVIEIEYTSEYKTADEARKNEIRELCMEEECVLKVEEEQAKEEQIDENGDFREGF